ncbi:hypothetical protein P5V15_000775 [Pogonomyrmex californicus]
MLVRAPYTLPLFFVVCCWFRHNAAIPLASHSSSQIQNAFKDKKANSQDNWDSTSQSDSSKETETSEENNDEIQNAIKNQNMNVNMNIFDRKDRHRFTRNRNEHHKPNTTENILLVTGKEALEQIAKEKESTNCASSKKKNQRYSSSFIENSTSRSINVDKEFDEVVGNNSKVKRTSSVHEGEDITLCWIELTTIKEDKVVRPPKKLVIREYIISFENSATIPEKYLECKKFEGELAANDPEIGQTALFEVIDEDTMVSRIVNFTSVSHVGDVVVWEHKSVKCGVGPVVSKNIVELSDGSKNPKKRVEIKVSPKMHQLTATKAEEETEEPCTDDYEEEKSEESSTIKSTTEYTAEITTGFAGILPEHDREISSSEESVSEQSKLESESEENLSGITKLLETLPDEEIFERTTIFPKIPTTIQEFSEKIDCEENSSDPVCLMQKSASSSEELFPESSSTSEAVVTEVVTETSPITLVDTKMSVPIAEKEISSEERSEEVTESLSTSKEEEEIVSKLAEKTTPVAFTTGISEESSKVSQSTDKVSVDEGSATTLETEMTTSYIVKEDMEEHLKSKEGSGEGFIELTSEELDKISHVLFTSASTAASEEAKQDVTTAKQDVTTAIPSIEFTEFAKESEKSGMILDKLGGETVSTEGIIKNISTESSEEVYIGGSEESMTFTSEEASLFKVKTTKEEEFITTTISPTKIKSTTSELELCENSEDCASVANSEACDESGNCDKTITKSCESEICSEEERETVEERLPSKTTKIKSVIDLSEESTIGSRYTTVANVAATMLTSQENENNSTAINVPTITDSRRSTTTSTTPQHKLALKVKVLLEHINENKEKHNLVEVEKQLLLDENPQHHDNPDLLEQLKSLNDSVNMETINALLNCTSLGNLTKDTNFVKKERSGAADSKNEELEFINSDFENSISDQTSDYIDFRNENSEYDSEHEILSRRRRRRSLDEENLTKQNLYDPTDSVTDPLNISRIQEDYLMKENIQLSTTTEEETNNTTYTENEGNVTTAEDEITMPSTKMNISDDIDFSNVTEFHDANLTMEDIQSTTTTNKSEEETSIIALDMENENVTTERNESTTSLIESINNNTKLEVVRESLPGIQEDVVVGLQHMVSQMAQNQLNSINKSIKEVVKTNLMDVIADPKDSRVHSRRRRAATEELGHWSNERIKEAPMGGNLRTLTEFTLYKVFP